MPISLPRGETAMENVFKAEPKHVDFSWASIGDIKEGRENLGEDMPVLVYRLLQYSVNHVLVTEMGQEQANHVFRTAGELVGHEYARNALDLTLGMDPFLAQLQASLKSLRIGILRMEMLDDRDGSFVLTVGEDLDCSGLPITNEVVCVYDEGFIAGIFEEYTGKPYKVREVDCWASGARVCRFKGVQGG
jgi:predicted hydrocarbon binding protein